MGLASMVCADIRRKLDNGRIPLQYMNITDGFRLQADDMDRLVLLHTGDPTTKEEVGYREYDQQLPGMRWYLKPEWRSGVKMLLCRLGMYRTIEEDEDIPF